ncbi:MAG: hypothetical protein E4H14_10340 [Candidatus Thorarchaeota archaeon]|nr:MAG: hypothetical protein E4H14_10340 [Candidatus Thorarchaeota archaeon]
MPNEEVILSKEEAEKILKLYLGSNSWLAGNFSSLKKYRTKLLDMEEIYKSGQISIEDLRRFLGVKELAQYDLDTHLGQLSKYAWLKGAHPTGAGFSPIFDLIEKIKEKYPDEQKRLRSIERRLAYLCFLRDELKYMNKRYDYEEIPITFEFYSNKVEVYATLLVDLLMVIAELWCDYPDSKPEPGPRPRHFEELFDCFTPLEKGGYKVVNSINIMLELSAAISARHIYVHNIGPEITLTNEGGVITYEIPEKQRYGEFERYMQIELYDSLEKLPPSNQDIDVYDPRFPEFLYKIRRAKQGRFDYRGSRVRYNGEVPQFINMLDRLLGMIGRAVFISILG